MSDQRSAHSSPRRSAAVQRQQNAKAGQVRLVHDMMCQLHDLRLGEYLHLPLFTHWQLGVYPRAEASPLGRRPQDGPQQYANIPCAFGRQAMPLELPVKIRYPLLRQRIQRRSAQLRLDILLYHIPIPADSGLLQLSPRSAKNRSTASGSVMLLLGVISRGSSRRRCRRFSRQTL